MEKFSIHSQSIRLAIKRGDLESRSRQEAQKSKIFWEDIQIAYDSGDYTWRSLCEKFNISFTLLSNASKDGRFKSRSPSDAAKLSYKKGVSKPTPMSESRRKQQSESFSLNNPGGKCKWYIVNGIKVQGSWERDVALKLNEDNICWTRPKKDQLLWYTIDNKTKSYAPDFYLPTLDIFLEIKGYWWHNDRMKMDIVQNQHPDKKIIIIEKDSFDYIIANGFVKWFNEL